MDDVAANVVIDDDADADAEVPTAAAAPEPAPTPVRPPTKAALKQGALRESPRKLQVVMPTAAAATPSEGVRSPVASGSKHRAPTSPAKRRAATPERGSSKPRPASRARVHHARTKKVRTEPERPLHEKRRPVVPAQDRPLNRRQRAALQPKVKKNGQIESPDELERRLERNARRTSQRPTFGKGSSTGSTVAPSVRDDDDDDNNSDDGSDDDDDDASDSE